MPEIRLNRDFVTQITTAEAEEGKQDELLALMTERARFMARQPGFVSISLHRGLDGRRIVNYVQWAQSPTADRGAPYAGVPGKVVAGRQRLRGDRAQSV